MHVKSTIVVQKYGLMVAQASWYDVDSLQQQAERLGREDQQRLHRNKKLVLMVDLDQTLIHTTEQHCQRMSNKVIHLHVPPPDLTSMSFTSWFFAVALCCGTWGVFRVAHQLLRDCSNWLPLCWLVSVWHGLRCLTWCFSWSSSITFILDTTISVTFHLSNRLQTLWVPSRRGWPKVHSVLPRIYTEILGLCSFCWPLLFHPAFDWPYRISTV